MEALQDSLRLYSLTIIIPLCGSIMICIAGFLGFDLIHGGVIPAIKALWIDYYFSGMIGTMIAWRIHVVIFSLIFLSNIFR